MACVTPLRVGVALDGAGWHLAAWRESDTAGRDLFTAGHWTGLAQEAERGKLDFLTIEDSLGPPPTEPGRVVGRLDAALIAARIAPLTSRIGLIPTVTTTHPEPFHISTAIATLDFVSSGRGGWRARTGRPSETPHFGRRNGLGPGPVTDEQLIDRFDEAADVVEAVRRLWDSWEDGAIIRDAESGRFLDRHRLHYVDFESRFFSVKGPSITPRPPQGQPVVAALAHGTVPYRFAARSADLVLVTPADDDACVRIVDEVRAQESAVDRAGPALRIFADLVVFLDDTEAAAIARKARLDDLHGGECTSDAAIFVGTADQLGRRLQSWQRAGIEGFRLRPGALPHDLHAITRSLVPNLQENDAFRRGYEARTLRALLGLPRAVNRYEVAYAAPGHRRAGGEPPRPAG